MGTYLRLQLTDPNLTRDVNEFLIQFDNSRGIENGPLCFEETSRKHSAFGSDYFKVSSTTEQDEIDVFFQEISAVRNKYGNVLDWSASIDGPDSDYPGNIERLTDAQKKLVHTKPEEQKRVSWFDLKKLGLELYADFSFTDQKRNFVIEIIPGETIALHIENKLFAAGFETLSPEKSQKAYGYIVNGYAAPFLTSTAFAISNLSFARAIRIDDPKQRFRAYKETEGNTAAFDIMDSLAQDTEESPAQTPHIDTVLDNVSLPTDEPVLHIGDHAVFKPHQPDWMSITGKVMDTQRSTSNSVAYQVLPRGVTNTNDTIRLWQNDYEILKIDPQHAETEEIGVGFTWSSLDGERQIAGKGGAGSFEFYQVVTTGSSQKKIIPVKEIESQITKDKEAVSPTPVTEPVEDNYVAGFSWESKKGKNTILGQAEGRPDGWLKVQKEGSRFNQYIHKDDIADEVYRDTKNLESEKKWQDQEAEASAKAAAKKMKYKNVQGFADDMDPKRKANAINALNKLTKVNDKIVTRKKMIEDLVTTGATTSTREESRVQPMSRTAFNRANQAEQDAHEKRIRNAGTKRVYSITNPVNTGSWYDITKTEYDYANYLIDRTKVEAVLPAAESAENTEAFQGFLNTVPVSRRSRIANILNTLVDETRSRAQVIETYLSIDHKLGYKKVNGISKKGILTPNGELLSDFTKIELEYARYLEINDLVPVTEDITKFSATDLRELLLHNPKDSNHTRGAILNEVNKRFEKGGFLKELGWPDAQNSRYRNKYTGQEIKLKDFEKIDFSLTEHWEPDIGINTPLLDSDKEGLENLATWREKHPHTKKLSWKDRQGLDGVPYNIDGVYSFHDADQPFDFLKKTLEGRIENLQNGLSADGTKKDDPVPQGSMVIEDQSVQQHLDKDPAATNAEILKERLLALNASLEALGWQKEGLEEYRFKTIKGGFKGTINPEGNRRLRSEVKAGFLRAMHGDKELVSIPFSEIPEDKLAKKLDDFVMALPGANEAPSPSQPDPIQFWEENRGMLVQVGQGTQGNYTFFRTKNQKKQGSRIKSQDNWYDTREQAEAALPAYAEKRGFIPATQEHIDLLTSRSFKLPKINSRISIGDLKWLASMAWGFDSAKTFAAAMPGLMPESRGTDYFLKLIEEDGFKGLTDFFEAANEEKEKYGPENIAQLLSNRIQMSSNSADLVAESSQPEDIKPWQKPNVVFREVVDFHDRILGYVFKEYDGKTKEDALNKAQSLTPEQIESRYPGFSNINSRMGATDAKGNPLFAISPNLRHVHHVLEDRDAAMYNWGDIEAGERLISDEERRMMIPKYQGYIKENQIEIQGLFQGTITPDDRYDSVEDQITNTDRINQAHLNAINEQLQKLGEGPAVQEPHEYRMGDLVEHEKALWEVGFINHTFLKGTLRLQKNGNADAEQINYIYPEKVRLISPALPREEPAMELTQSQDSLFDKEKENLKRAYAEKGYTLYYYFTDDIWNLTIGEKLELADRSVSPGQIRLTLTDKEDFRLVNRTIKKFQDLLFSELDKGHVKEKLDKIKEGQSVVIDDESLDLIGKIDPEAMNDICTFPNPDRMGTKDLYLAGFASNSVIKQKRIDKGLEEPDQAKDYKNPAGKSYPAVLPYKQQLHKHSKYIGKLFNDLGIGKEIANTEEYYGKIFNEPWMPLTIERHGDLIYLTHYYEQNGDLVMDGEMVFQIYPKTGHLMLKETAVSNPVQGGELRGCDATFANMFARNLKEQDFGKCNVVDPRKQDPAPEAAAPKLTADDFEPNNPMYYNLGGPILDTKEIKSFIGLIAKKDGKYDLESVCFAVAKRLDNPLLLRDEIEKEIQFRKEELNKNISHYEQAKTYGIKTLEIHIPEGTRKGEDPLCNMLATKYQLIREGRSWIKDLNGVLVEMDQDAPLQPFEIPARTDAFFHGDEINLQFLIRQGGLPEEPEKLLTLLELKQRNNDTQLEQMIDRYSQMLTMPHITPETLQNNINEIQDLKGRQEVFMLAIQAQREFMDQEDMAVAP